MNNIFLREKKSSKSEMKYRTILNLKKLNKKFVRSNNFQLDGLNTCLDMMEPFCYMASIDLSNAYHTIPMHPDYTKFLKFSFENQVYRYLVLPQGFRDSTRIFVKILKPVLSMLRANNLLSSSYIDEFYLQGSSYQNCMNNVLITKQILLKLGFELSDKSVYQPTQSLAHLGFILDSRVMKVFLGKDKKIS